MRSITRSLRCACSLIALGLVVLFVACSSGSSGGRSALAGEVLVGLTDAPGDFLVYAVDISSMTLTTAGGATVQTLPLQTRVDFTEVADLTEFLTAATVPAATYTAAVMVLDFGNADIQVDVNGTATAVPAANIRDAGGNPVSSLEVTVQFANLGSLSIVPGVPAHLNLDFDLESSNAVDSSVSPPVVTVEPLLEADVNRTNARLHRVRGPLVSVDSAAATLRIAIRPFRIALNSGTAFGTLTVSTDANTVFEVDGVASQGSAGFAALAAKGAATAVIARGSLDAATRTFLATQVEAGSSVPRGTDDVVHGTVVARAGDVLTVKGATLERAAGALTRNTEVQVTVDATTLVRKQFAAATAFTKEDLSVGQRITCFGEVSGGAAPFAFDARGTTAGGRSGLVRMLLSSVDGSVNSLSTGGIELDVQRVNGRRVALYDFSGTGAGTTDAVAATYTVDTGTLDTTAIAAGEALQVRGFPVAFGQAGASDFTARSIVDVSDSAALLLVNWKPASAAPLDAAAAPAGGLALDLSGAGVAHHVHRAGLVTDLTGTSPKVVPANSSQDRFIVRSGATVTVHTQFQEFLDDVAALLAAGKRAVGFNAVGRYEDASTTMSASRVAIGLR